MSKHSKYDAVSIVSKDGFEYARGYVITFNKRHTRVHIEQSTNASFRGHQVVKNSEIVNLTQKRKLYSKEKKERILMFSMGAISKLYPEYVKNVNIIRDKELLMDLTSYAFDVAEMMDDIYSKRYE
jgi:hypothetical protein